MTSVARIPRATYRVQMHRDFGFDSAAQIVPYLAKFGVSHLYVSPILKARAGSAHGYDVIDFTTLNPELGTRADFDALVDCLHAHDMGLVVDVVPNHMGVMGSDNAWWLDVLENGPIAEYADFFDIDWQPVRTNMQDRLLVPVLGGAFGAVLEQGEMRVEFAPEDASFSVRYHEHRFPIDPREYPRIFTGREGVLESVLADDESSRHDFESLLADFGRLPARNDVNEQVRSERYRDKEVHKRRLARLCERAPALNEYIAGCLQAINGTIGEPRSFDALAELLDAQAYRLAYWRVAGDEINYRRFFDINTLAALRMDDRRVFNATHALIAELVKCGAIDGLRIDHPDGLYDPAQYIKRVQALFQDPLSAETKPVYIVAEKILASHERLPEWSLHGTTGYEFGALITAWQVDHEAEAHMTRTYENFVGDTRSFEELVVASKKLVMKSALAAEIAVLAMQLDRIAQMDRHTADFTRFVLRDTIVDTIAHFPVYRTYVTRDGVSDDDRRHVQWAINVARKRSQAPDASAFQFLHDVLLLNETESANDEVRSAARRRAIGEFAIKFQQVTAPVMAKGVEDTSFYLYHRLAALNEVGGDPRRFGVSTAALHQANLERAKHWPHAMLNTSTHDSKRDEDVRARLVVLSEIHREWRRHMARWSRINRRRRSIVDDAPAPSRDDEYLLYQTLLGAWPAQWSAADASMPPSELAELIDRLKRYIVKAAREAKAHTSWTNRNDEYEAACERFVERLLEEPVGNAFLRDFETVRAPVAFFGFLNSLSQTLLKLTAPGVPDLYQGIEIPSCRLVDPDNRIAVDFSRLARSLEDLRARTESANARASPVRDLLTKWTDGRLKHYVIWRSLQARAMYAELFAHGEYLPLRVVGEHAEHVCAFMRTHQGDAMLVAAPRLMVRMVGGALPSAELRWGATHVELPDAYTSGRWRDVFSDDVVTVALPAEARDTTCVVSVAELFRMLPLSLCKWEP